ncbi:hypothetical protein [Verminephrobacter eiseniae]|uniref:hypothetical protein n=1 Tax=Verminephrobacter eiseniae TaxID=364317 RepID=UPI0022370348|nr:hypothetical protein [Verminephrobacter eiseniae]
MIIKIGFWIFVTGLVIAVSTSNLFISAKEKSLAQKFKIQRQSNSAVDAETKYAYMNLLIANVTRFLMVVGLVLVIIGLVVFEQFSEGS